LYITIQMKDSDSTPKKPLDPEQAYYKITAFCSFRDRSRKEVLAKLSTLGVSKDIAKNIISKLEEEGYLNEARMAQSYAGGKFRIKAWGKRKIELHMKHLGLADQLISEGLAQINEEDYLEKLYTLAHKKWESLAKDEEQVRMGKTMRYLANKGYESEKIWEVMKRLGAID
jgi:regulatory protein